jgi:hypothetical protein
MTADSALLAIGKSNHYLETETKNVIRFLHARVTTVPNSLIQRSKHTHLGLYFWFYYCIIVLR